MNRLAHISIAAALAVSAAACGGSSAAQSVVAPSATVTTETFNGIVQPLATNVHTFNVTTPGSLSVTMTAAGPPATITMGLGVGNPNAAGTCIFLTSGTTSGIASTTTPQLSGTLAAAGAYCVAIADIGNAVGPITYSLTVSHT